MAILNANQQPAFIALQAYLGTQGYTQRDAIDYTNSSITGAQITAHTVQLPATSTTVVSLVTLFANCPNPQFFCAQDNTTTPGQNFGVAFAAGTYAFVAPLGFWGYSCDGTVLPNSIYLNNPNATVGVVSLSCITN